jgi:hypothetical protein
MILSQVFEVLAAERAYHLRRWGCRQPDGTLHEQPHSVGEFLIYMRDYFDEATHQLSRGPGCYEALATLRKVVALATACLEQHDSYGDAHVTLDDIFETVRRSGRIVPVRPSWATDLSTYLLKIRQCLVDAEVKLGAMNPDAGLVIFREIVRIGVECLEREGAPPREYQETVINLRDGLPA